MPGTWTTDEHGTRLWIGSGTSKGWKITVYPQYGTVYADNEPAPRGDGVDVDIVDGEFAVNFIAPYDGSVGVRFPAEVAIELLRLRGLIP